MRHKGPCTIVPIGPVTTNISRPLSAPPTIRLIQRMIKARDARATQNKHIIIPETPNVAETAKMDANTKKLPAHTAPNILSSERRAHNVLKEAQKYGIAEWMTAQEEKRASKIPSKAVFNFPQSFRVTPNANIAGATRYWNDRLSTIQSYTVVCERKKDLQCAVRIQGDRNSGFRRRTPVVGGSAAVELYSSIRIYVPTSSDCVVIVSGTIQIHYSFCHVHL